MQPSTLAQARGIKLSCIILAHLPKHGKVEAAIVIQDAVKKTCSISLCRKHVGSKPPLAE